MIFGLRKTFNDYEEVRVDDMATRYRYFGGPAAVSADGSTVALIEEWIEYKWVGTPGTMTLIARPSDGRVHVRHGSDWNTDTFIGFTSGFGGYYHGAHGSAHGGKIAMSADGSVIAYANQCDNGSAGSLEIHYGSSWASSAVFHGNLSYQDTEWGNYTWWGYAVAVSGDGSTVVVSEPLYGGMEQGRIHVYSGTNYATHTIINSPSSAWFCNFGRYLAISYDGSVIFAASRPSQGAESTWYGTPGASDHDVDYGWTNHVYALTGAGWGTSTDISGRTVVFGEHYHYNGITSDYQNRTWYVCDGHQVAGNYLVPQWRAIDCSDDGSLLFVGDPSYQDEKGAVFQFSGASWATKTIIQLSGTTSNTYVGASYTTDILKRGSGFGDAVRCDADGDRLFAFSGFDNPTGDQSGTYYEFDKSSGTWTAAGGTVLDDSPEHESQPEIARGNYPIMVNAAQSSGLWGEAWWRVDLRSFGMNAAAVIRKVQSKSATASAIVRRNRTGSFAIESLTSYPYIKVMSILKRTWVVTPAANATIMPRFFANAIKLKTWLKSFAFGAYIHGTLRTTHPRDNTAHYDLDFDSVITLAQAMGIYPAGMDLHTVLTAVVGRVAALEARSDDFPLDFTAGAILRRPDVSAALTAAAALVRRTSVDAVVDAILLRIQQPQVTADSILRTERSSSATLDAYVLSNAVPFDTYADAVILKAIEMVAAAAAVVLREQSSSLTGDALINVLRSESALADAVVFKSVQGQTTADVVLLRSMDASFSADAIFTGGVVEGTLTADAILLRELSGSATIDAMQRIIPESYGTMIRALNPLVWYRFSEPDGQFIDSGSVARNATLTGGPTRNAAGVVDDDSGATFSGAEYATTAVYTLAIGNVLTIEAWIYPTSTGRRTIWSGSNTSGQLQLEIGGNGTDRLSAIINGTFVAETNNNAITRNAWNHVVYRRSGTGASTHRLWVNGVEQSLATNAANDYTNSNVAKLVGARVAGSQQFTGTIDEIVIFGTALDPAEILKHYSARSSRMGLSSRAIIKRLDQTGTRTIDANILPAQPLTRLDAIKRKEYPFSITAGAIARRPTPLDLTADAVVSNATTTSQSFTAEAFIQPYFRIGAWIIGVPDAFQVDTFQDDTFQ